MKNPTILFMAVVLFVSCQQSATKETNLTSEEPNMSNHPSMELDGASILAFGPENVLFIGDSKGAKIHAVTTTAVELKDPIPFNFEGFDAMVAKKLNIESRDVIINDMKIHPLSQEAYVSIKKGHQPDAKSVVVIVNPATSAMRILEVNETNSTSVAINNPASADLIFWKETPATALSITDIDYNDGYLYVAGLTNSEFASTVRKIAYPFTNSQEALASLEIYHAVHTQNETRAPIRTMLFDELDGVSTLIASYTCTPLVTIPSDDIKEGVNIKGKTIAELGYGNTPIDMITVMTQGMDGTMTKNLLITNKNRGGSLIPFNSVIAGSKGKGLAGTQAMHASGLEGIQQIPTANVMHIDIQNQQMLGVVRRNIETGDIDLISELTASYLRLSDFISEYDFPDYRYDKKQEGTKQYHDMAKQMEGYPDLVSEKMKR